MNFDFTILTPYAAPIFFGFIALLILVLAWFGSRPVYVEPEPEEDVPYVEEVRHRCGSDEDHYEDYPLYQVLEVGQVYHKVFCRKTPRCNGDGDYYLVWIQSFDGDTCCGYEELVAFDQEPPDTFVYDRNGKVVEVTDGNSPGDG